MYQIYDRYNKAIGRPEGYDSIGKALGVVNNKRTKVYRHIWTQPTEPHVTVYSIRPMRGD